MVNKKIAIPHEKIEWSTLSSGLKVITVEMPHFYTISAGLFAHIGSRFEKKEEEGLSHFIEHLLFKGSKKYTALEISEIIEGRGGFLNAYTAEESTCFYFKTLLPSFFDSLDVLVDLYTEPLFDPIEIGKEKDVIIEEINSYEDQPGTYVEDLFGSLIWKGHPLGNFILGNKENILRFVPRDIKDFFDRYYTAPNTVLAVAGNIEHKEVLSWIKKNEKRFVKGTHNPYLPFILEQKKSRAFHLYKEIEQCHMQLGFPCPGRKGDEQWALRLLNTIAGENMSSHLFQEIREKRGLAYHIASSVDFHRDVGCFSLQVGIDVEKVEICIRESLKVLEKLKEKRIGKKELERAKTYSIGQALQDMESTLSYMLWVGDKLLNDEEDFSTATFCEKIEGVTAEEIRGIAEEIFLSHHLNCALIGPYDKKIPLRF